MKKVKEKSGTKMRGEGGHGPSPNLRLGGGGEIGIRPPPPQKISARSAEKGIFAASKAPRREFSEILACLPLQLFK